jgi:cell division protein FtsW
MFFLFSASSVSGLEKFGSPWFFLKKQFLGILVGLFCFFILTKFKRLSYLKLKKLSLFFLILNILLLLLCFVPELGLSGATANRWISVPGFTLQPSEFLKISLIMFLASFLASKSKSDIQSVKKTLIPYLIIIGIVAIPIFLQPSTSILFILCIACFVMYFCANTPFLHTLILIGLGVACVVGLLIFTGDSYRGRRIQAFFNKDTSELVEIDQLKQSEITLGSGGLFGVGYNKSSQKYSYLAESHTDSIFAIIGEETGFVGAISISFLYLLFFWYGISIAKRAYDTYGAYLAIGITSAITIQAFCHIFSVCGLIPTTGIPLPFISYGASSLVACLIGVGLLQNIYINH